MLPPDAKLQRLDTMPIEPLSLIEAKQYCRIDSADDDLLIPDLITAARIKCEQVSNASLTAAQYQLTCDYLPWGGSALGFWQTYQSSYSGNWWDASTIELPNPPLVAVQSIQYVGLDNIVHPLEPSTYRVSPGSPGQIQPAYGTLWPFVQAEIGAVQITYTAGMDAIKLMAVKAAIRLMVDFLYTSRGEDAPIPQAIGYILDPVRNYSYA